MFPFVAYSPCFRNLPKVSPGWGEGVGREPPAPGTMLAAELFIPSLACSGFQQRGLCSQLRCRSPSCSCFLPSGTWSSRCARGRDAAQICAGAQEGETLTANQLGATSYAVLTPSLPSTVPSSGPWSPAGLGPPRGGFLLTQRGCGLTCRLGILGEG